VDSHSSQAYLITGTTLFDDLVGGFEGLCVEPQYTIVALLTFFALFHSGLAYLRPWGAHLLIACGLVAAPTCACTPYASLLPARQLVLINPPLPVAGEAAIGPRAWRVMFASISLPLATICLMYFINHRYDGTPLWDIRQVPYVHDAMWVATFVSFLLLYPSTFNLLEVAAVDKPVLHMWETGVTRITRHPQAWGQLLWCVAHTAWIGNSFMVWTSLALCAHHAFGCWHGDLRLARQYGEAFEELKRRTSVVPFAAIADGRQQLPKDYWREFVRVPYAGVVIFTLGAYWAHPLMQQAAYYLDW